MREARARTPEGQQASWRKLGGIVTLKIPPPSAATSTSHALRPRMPHTHQHTRTPAPILAVGSSDSESCAWSLWFFVTLLDISVLVASLRHRSAGPPGARVLASDRPAREEAPLIRVCTCPCPSTSRSVNTRAAPFTQPCTKACTRAGRQTGPNEHTDHLGEAITSRWPDAGKHGRRHGVIIVGGNRRPIRIAGSLAVPAVRRVVALPVPPALGALPLASLAALPLLLPHAIALLRFEPLPLCTGHFIE